MPVANTTCIPLQAVCYQNCCIKKTLPHLYAHISTSHLQQALTNVWFELLIQIKNCSVLFQTPGSACKTHTHCCFCIIPYWLTARHSSQAGMDVAADTVDGCCVSSVADATPALLKCLSLSRRSLSGSPVTLVAVSPCSVSIFRQEESRSWGVIWPRVNDWYSPAVWENLSVACHVFPSGL